MFNEHVMMKITPYIYKGKIHRSFLGYIKRNNCKSKICLPTKIYIAVYSLILLKTNFIIRQLFYHYYGILQAK